MASIEYVVNAVDDASGTFEKIARSSDQLAKDLDELGRKVARPDVALEGDKNAILQLDRIALKIDKLRETVKPGVELENAARTQLEIDRLSASLDRLDRKRVSPTIDLNDRGGGLGGLIRRLFGGGGAAGAAGGAAQGAGGGIGGLLGAVGPYGQAAGWGLLGALGAITAPALLPTGIGGGVGLLGAILGDPKGLKDLMKNLTATIRTALAPLKDSFNDIFSGFTKFIKDEGPALRDLFKASLPFLQMFVTVLEQAAKTILPVVTQSLKQMTPYLPLMAQGFAAVFQGIAQMIKAIGPRGMEASAKLFVDLCKIMGYALTGLGKALNFIAVATQETAAFLHHQWDNVRHDTAVIFDDMRRFFATWGHDVAHNFDSFRHTIASIFSGLYHDVISIWDAIWRNTVSRVASGVRDVENWFHSLPARVQQILGGLGRMLEGIGKGSINDFLAGMKSVAGGLLSWIGNFVKNIWSKVKSFFGIASPSSLFYDIGKNLMLGLSNGIKDHAHLAQQAASSVAGGTPGVNNPGVMRWAPVVSQVLRTIGLPQSDAGVVLRQMQAESGGDPTAVNRWDSNWARGTPSVGLMQVIGPTFAAYAGAYRNVGPFAYGVSENPFANIFSGLSYALARYGANWVNVLGHGHGYSSGGWVNEPVVGYGLRSGDRYSFGETGSEVMLRRWGGGNGRGITPPMIINVCVQPEIAAVTPDRKLGRQIAEHILAHTRGGGRLYPQGVSPR